MTTVIDCNTGLRFRILLLLETEWSILNHDSLVLSN